VTEVLWEKENKNRTESVTKEKNTSTGIENMMSAARSHPVFKILVGVVKFS